MDTPLKIAIVSIVGGGSFGIAIAFLNRFFSIRSARPAAAAVLIRQIELTIPYDNDRALNRNQILTLEDVAKLKAHLWFWQVKKLNALWSEFEKYQHGYHPSRVQSLQRLLAFAKIYV